MVGTSTKNADTFLTPVRFLESPATAKSTTSTTSFVVCQTRLEQISKTLQDNYTKWQLAHTRGLSLCSSIEAIKTRSLEAANKIFSTPNATDATLYPKELQVYCDKLAIIASIFVDIITNTHESMKQLRSLSKLLGSSNEIFFRTWQLLQFIQFVEELLDRYSHEARVKQHVMQNLPHCNLRDEFIHCTSAWEYPQYVDEWVSLSFAFLKQELGGK